MTNLPELPEGYFWRVEHPWKPLSPHKEWLRGRGYDVPAQEDESKLQVSLRQNYTYECRERVNRGKNVITNFWFAGETVELSKKLERTRTLFTRECKGVHAQAVVNAANVIMKEWTKQKETAKLLGNYPPKEWSA